MNDSIFGIVITILIVGIVLSIGVGLQGGVDIPIPAINIEQPVAEPTQSNAYYEWCYKMGVSCQ